MPHHTDQAARLLALAKRDTTSFLALASHPDVDISATGFLPNKLLKNALRPLPRITALCFAERMMWTSWLTC